MRMFRPVRWIVPGLMLAAAAACDDGVRTDRLGLADAGGEPDAGEVVNRSAGGAAAVDDAAPREIYYDLTAHGWYRRGRPLRAGGYAYQPEGRPRGMPGRALRRAGRYAGVDYYVPPGRQPPHDTVFVPVFPDYWQPFVAQDSEPERLAD